MKTYLIALATFFVGLNFGWMLFKGSPQFDSTLTPIAAHVVFATVVFLSLIALWQISGLAIWMIKKAIAPPKY